MEKARVAVIELVIESDTLKGNLVLYECNNPRDLKHYLSSFDKHRADILRRIFIVEWSSGGPNTSDTAQPGSIRHILETEVHVPADFFSEHASHGVGSYFEPQESAIVNPCLITTFCPERRFSVGLFDLWEYTGKTEDLMTPCPITHRMLVPGDAGLILVCGDTARQLQFHEWRTRQGWLIIAPRKLSYWSHWVGEEEGEDAVILVDPTPDTAIPQLPVIRGVPAPEPISLEQRHPFLGGYQEFLPRNLAVQGELSAVTREALKAHPIAAASDSRSSRPAPNDDDRRRRDRPEEIDTLITSFQVGIQNGNTIEMKAADYKAGISRKKEDDQARMQKIEDLKECILQDLEHTVSPRTSLFDDLRYYFARHSNILGSLMGLQSPSSQPLSHLSSSVAIFPLKLVASHYCLLHAFVSFQTASMRSAGWSLKDDTAQQREESSQVEEAWSRFRCSEYLEGLESLMDNLGIPLYGAGSCAPVETTPLLRRAGTGLSTGYLGNNTSSEPPWISAIAPDFTFLHRQFTMRRHDYDRITTSIAALAGIVTGRVAVMEARSARSLTYVAMLFAPLAWVAAVYSMPEEFAPGRPLFWKYWATAVPSMLLVWCLMTIWERRREVARMLETARRRNWEAGVSVDDTIV